MFCVSLSFKVVPLTDKCYYFLCISLKDSTFAKLCIIATSNTQPQFSLSDVLNHIDVWLQFTIAYCFSWSEITFCFQIGDAGWVRL